MRRAVLARDGHQCAYTAPFRIGEASGLLRCSETEGLQIHHIRYDQGDDIAWLTTLCRSHHELLESKLRPWNRNRLGR